MSGSVRFLPLLPALCLVACSGTGSAPEAEASRQAVVTGNRIKTGDGGDDDYGRLVEKYGSRSQFATDANGNLMAAGKAATQFDRANSQFQSGQNYQAGEFRKTSWWGNSDYVKKVYGGDTDASDLKTTSRLNGAAAGENVKVARDAGRSFGTGTYATGAAAEAGGRRLDRPSDTETDLRREVFTDPDVIGWQQQNGATLERTKLSFGR